MSLLFASPALAAVAEVSLPWLVDVLGYDELLEVLDDVLPVVLWSASIEPTLLVPVAVSASGAADVVAGRLVSVCVVAWACWLCDHVSVLGSACAAAAPNSTDEITIASVCLRIWLPSLVMVSL